MWSIHPFSSASSCGVTRKEGKRSRGSWVCSISEMSMVSTWGASFFRICCFTVWECCSRILSCSLGSGVRSISFKTSGVLIWLGSRSSTYSSTSSRFVTIFFAIQSWCADMSFRHMMRSSSCLDMLSSNAIFSVKRIKTPSATLDQCRLSDIIAAHSDSEAASNADISLSYSARFRLADVVLLSLAPPSTRPDERGRGGDGDTREGRSQTLRLLNVTSRRLCRFCSKFALRGERPQSLLPPHHHSEFVRIRFVVVILIPLSYGSTPCALPFLFTWVQTKGRWEGEQKTPRRRTG
mmetsp:Transcript_29398/g.71648  ORF Transcript_29398/g.71648 Transcript_29398/m.71648 type:complete len:294 (-) Transcript_29398:53-934(-)